MQQLSGQDAIFVHAEQDGLPQHIAGLTIYNPATAATGKVEYQDVVAHFSKRLHLARIFRQRLVEVPFSLDQPYWLEDPDFDVDFHMHHVALPKPGDWRALCDLVARLHAQPLDRSRPIWEAYFIEGLDNIGAVPPGAFAVFLKIHHAAMDGASGVELYMALHDLSASPRTLDEEPCGLVDREPGKLELISRAYLNNMRKTLRMMELPGQLVPAYRRVQQGKKANKFRILERKQRTRFNGKISSQRAIDARMFDFAELYAIKNTVPEATINDAVLTIVSGALRAYLLRHDELPQQSLVSGCPVNVRAEGERGQGGNAVGFINVALRTDIADPKRRLVAVHKEARQAKAFTIALGRRVAMDVTDSLPAGMVKGLVNGVVRTGLLGAAAPITNTVVTNVPGLPKDFFLAGAQVVSGFAAGPLLPDMGLFHTVMSTETNKKGVLELGFSACRTMLPDPDVYAACLQAAFNELKTATLGATPDKTNKRAGAKRRKTRLNGIDRKGNVESDRQGVRVEIRAGAVD